MFANCQMMGIDIGFPDVCMTPPVAAPIPYPNIAAGPMGVPAAYNILVSVGPAHNLTTTIPMTNGDNTGVMLGVASGMVMGPARHLTGAFTVLMGCIPGTRMTSMTLANVTNCPLDARLVPSQVKVLLLAP
jgi:hypothetical protein